MSGWNGTVHGIQKTVSHFLQKKSMLIIITRCNRELLFNRSIDFCHSLYLLYETSMREIQVVSGSLDCLYSSLIMYDMKLLKHSIYITAKYWVFLACWWSWGSKCTQIVTIHQAGACSPRKFFLSLMLWDGFWSYFGTQHITTNLCFI